ncbi:hypothetical protein M0Q28_05590 [Patescibacteria group bacterium]|jgi:hypothetical protein|nr:hypothetical protein [Patescibacteria group bacterium]
MIDGNEAKFVNIVLQLKDGTIRTFEPTRGQHVILATQDDNIKDGENASILMHASDDVTAFMILRLIENSPDIMPLVMLGILKIQAEKMTAMLEGVNAPTTPPKGGLN